MRRSSAPRKPQRFPSGRNPLTPPPVAFNFTTRGLRNAIDCTRTRLARSRPRLTCRGVCPSGSERSTVGNEPSHIRCPVSGGGGGLSSGREDQSHAGYEFKHRPLSIPPAGCGGLDRTFLRLPGERDAATGPKTKRRLRRIVSTYDAFHGHVRSMLGRGVKRKWSCTEELAAAEEKASVPREASRLQQRQRVLGLCLEKLQRYQAGMELSLRRSVLLVNTLRQIHDDMRGDAAEGAVRPDSPLLRDALSVEMSLTCPGCTEGGQESPFSAPSPELSSQEMSMGAELKPPISAFSDAVNGMGYLGDLALDDIFEDIDTSMYETSDLWTAGSLWPVSVSLWADQDARMRPDGHALPGSLQSRLMDLNELDHIMEILVKS
ncbi:SERTA domain-containing protein 3-like [Entelurus aequoreus]|uniref:SERTA domain-containing protein 3-like n=1 Tax=Entelurus aequoreus TaxID=161455 RepID=UPI002B1D6B12|nr:SERTA domain-containing protein 3-like [Entelurus aequoreus]